MLKAIGHSSRAVAQHYVEFELLIVVVGVLIGFGGGVGSGRALGIDEQRVKVILSLSGPAEGWSELGHGFRVVARIALWRGEDVLTIPVGALFREGADWATSVVRDGRVTLQRIALGERNEEFAQVLDGLAAGDEVILHPSDLVVEGGAVKGLPAAAE